jgi:uncharacterized protein YecT (DUF1311 family)
MVAPHRQRGPPTSVDGNERALTGMTPPVFLHGGSHAGDRLSEAKQTSPRLLAGLKEVGMKRFVLANCLVAVAAAASAQGTSESYAACIEKSGGTTSIMQDCIAKELAAQDKRLNTAYAALLTSKALPEKRKAQLRDVQRKWMAFRDANCAYYNDPDGGTAARLAANECVLTHTTERAAELEDLKPE